MTSMTNTNKLPTYMVTESCPKDEVITVIINSQEVRMQYVNWLQRELDRWNNKWQRRDAWIVEDKHTGNVSLHSWTGYYKDVPVDAEDVK